MRTTTICAVLLSMAVSFDVGAAQPQEVATGVLVFRGEFQPGRQPDGNSVVFETGDGLLVVDTGRHAEHTNVLIHYAKSSGRPITAIVNTHWHLDHVSGNILLRKEYPGVRVYGTTAVRHAREGFLREYRRQLTDMVATTADPAGRKQFEDEIARIDAGDAFVPNEIVVGPTVLNRGGVRFELHTANNTVTESDIWLYAPESGVLVAGDFVTLPVPFLDTACPPRWNDALDELAKIDFKVLVPGHGEPMRRKDFESWRAAFRNLLSCADSEDGPESCVDGWMADAEPLLEHEDQGFVRTLASYYAGLLASGRLDTNCPGR